MKVLIACEEGVIYNANSPRVSHENLHDTH